VTKVKDNTRKHYELHAVLIKELFWPISTRSVCGFMNWDALDYFTALSVFLCMSSAKILTKAAFKV